MTPLVTSREEGEEPMMTFLADPEIKIRVEKAALELGISEAKIWRHIAKKSIDNLLENGLNLRECAKGGAPPPVRTERK